MVVKAKAGGTITGLAADSKPPAAATPTGTIFLETDTRKRYYNSGTDWIAQEFPVYKKYKVFKVGTTTYVTDIHGKIFQSNSDTQTAVQAELNAMPNQRVYEFEWDATVFNMTNPLTLPVAPQAVIKKVKHQGTGYIGTRKLDSFATCLSADATFPTNRYFFEVSDPSPTASTTAQLEIDRFQVYNGNAFTTNVGFLKFEIGKYNGFENCVATNIYGNYLWRGIHLIGGVWWGLFQNIHFQASSETYTQGDAFIIVEDGGHTGIDNDVPKVNLFTNIHLAGVFEMNNAIRLRGCGYNTFRDVYIDGFVYRHSVISLEANTTTLGSVGNNLFDNVVMIDLNAVPTPDNRKGTLYLGATGTNKVWDNYFQNMHGQAYPVTIRLEGANVMRNDIEFDAFYGNNVNVNDTGADPSNTIRIKGGNINTSGGDVKITHTGETSRVIDTRRGAVRTGTATATGNGSQTAFNINHGCFASPALVTVTPYTVAASAPHYVGSSVTQINVIYATAPANAASLIWVWRAEVYR